MTARVKRVTWSWNPKNAMMKSIENGNPFSLAMAVTPGWPASVFRWAFSISDRLLGLNGIADLYAKVQRTAGPAEFCEATLRQLNARWEAAEEQINRIPKSGPLIVAANHPFGALEGLVLGVLLFRIRPDIKLLANYLLERIPELRPAVIAVDPFGGGDAKRRNAVPLRDAINWVRGGGALAVFPAGEVAHLTLRDRHVAEPPWSATIGKIIVRTKASVVPVFFEGRNSGGFQALGLLHPRLRTALLPRELLNKKNRSVKVAIGQAIRPETLRRCGKPSHMSDYLRLRTLMLAATLRDRRYACTNERRSGATLMPIAAAQDAERLEAEIDAIPETGRLAQLGRVAVYCSAADRIPSMLKEIGRQRELTFREVGEGTGRSEDMDRFDRYYLHLFAWDHDAQRLVGAYRVGLADGIVREHGLQGLYTHTLFKFGRRLMSHWGPAIELGRSFVVREYQRSYAPLLLLWKGIGRFLATHPRYRVLFGAVSISDDYDTTTKRILMSFLRANFFDADLSALATPRNPPALAPLRQDEAQLLSTAVQDVDDVDGLVREIEAGARGVPVLLRQYLKLNAKLIGFNVDPVFGNVLDGLFYVDLATIGRSLLERFMGREESSAYLAHHRAGIESPP